MIVANLVLFSCTSFYMHIHLSCHTHLFSLQGKGFMVTWWLKGQAQRRDSLTGMSLCRSNGPNSDATSPLSLILQSPMRLTPNKSNLLGRSRPLSVTKLPSHDSECTPCSPSRFSPNYWSEKSRNRPLSFTKFPSNDSDYNFKSPSRFSPNILTQKVANIPSKLPSHDSEISLKSPPRFASLNTSDLTKNKLLCFNKMPSEEGNSSQPVRDDVEDTQLSLPGYVVVEDLH